jgi:hypothetical protein
MLGATKPRPAGTNKAAETAKTAAEKLRFTLIMIFMGT